MLASTFVVLAYHVIFGCYGFWLPNDPRGSWSTFVRSYELYRAGGNATKVDTRRSVAHVPHDKVLRTIAKQALRYPPMKLTGVMAREVGRAIGEAGLAVHACCVMLDHVHLVLGRHAVSVEQAVRKIKQAATMRLREGGYVDVERPVWVRGCWKVFLNDLEAVRRAIRYVNDNPVRAGLKRQTWPFITPFIV